MTQEETNALMNLINEMRRDIDDLKHENQQLKERLNIVELSSKSVNPLYPEEERMEAGHKLDGILQEERKTQQLRDSVLTEAEKLFV